MKKIELLGSFRKDLKRIVKRGWDRTRLNETVEMLQRNESLPVSARPHKLSGEWLGFWECHIGPDWLLIYDFTDTKVLLAGTGTHTDLFD
jgi:mRNA interferase YafQ